MIELETSRLKLRPVSENDLDRVRAIGSDLRVMASLGGILSDDECRVWLERQLAHWRTHGYGRFRVDVGARFAGFVGLSRSDFDRGFVSGIEVAWRLAFEQWGNGYATEAARVVIEHGFAALGLNEVIGVTHVGNLRSRRVMDRLGMQHAPGETFEHPSVPAGHPLRMHVVYRLCAPPLR
ncbi:MAG TPA: GNAT family N-acetyltransferase [Polyangiaceae bacterium]|jgi:ribosomal-protein-alanine N-acetyltransferase